MNKKIGIKDITITAVFTAVIAALSQIAFPTPVGVSVTLQTLAISLTAFLIGPYRAVAATVCYGLLGALGVPVFAGFAAGLGTLLGPSGGFIFAFPVFALALALAVYVNKWALKALLIALALILLYIVGTIQFVVVTGNSLGVAVSAFALYFVKDVIVVLAAYFLCVRIRPTLSKFMQSK